MLPAHPYERALERLTALINLRSETDGEEAATAHLREVFATIGATMLLDDGVNVAAALDFGPGPALLYLAHHDTVPIGDVARWTFDPLGGEIAGGKLYGRGASDCKGGLAAMIEAAVALRSHAGSLSGRLILSSVREEESDLAKRGILRLLEKGLTANMAVVGEPSDNLVCLGHRGRYVLRVHTKGLSGHASRPERGVNAISHMAAVIAALDAMPLPEHAVLGGGTQCITTIHGGVAQNVIPEWTAIEVDRRPIMGETPETVLAEFRDALQQAGERVPGLDASVELLSTLHPSLIDAGEPIAQAAQHALEAVRGGPAPSPAAMPEGHTDQEWLVNDAAIPTVILGPNGGNIHAPDEFVYVDQVIEATKIYTVLGLDLLAKR